VALEQLAYFDGAPLQETAVQGMLDAIYSEDYEQTWRGKVVSASKQFEKEALSTARPFDTDDALSRKFDELFDGYEVVPRSLLHEYESLLEAEALLASSLTVGISKQMFQRLSREGRIEFRKDSSAFVADCGYTPEHGLDLAVSSNEDTV
jgi:hypothetical protein